MKTGKVSQAILDRSVLRPLSRAGVLTEKGAVYGRDCAFLTEKEAAFGRDCALLTEKEAAFGRDCALLTEKGTVSGKREEENIWEGAEKKACASVCGTLGGDCDRSVEMLIASGANNLAVSGAEPECAALSILFPADWEETELKLLLERAGAWCSRQQIFVAGGHTEVSAAVRRPVFSVTAWGTVRKECGRLGKGLEPEQDLVMAGWAGLAGTAILAKNREKELAERYPFSIIDTAKAFEQQILIREAAQAGLRFGISAMHDVSQGGIFGALWEMAECAGVGLEVDLKKIPIRQETIEICEYFDLNPYQLYGQGALLLGTSRGEALAEHLNLLGIPASVIGQTTSGNDRILRNGEDMRFLDRPAQDALWTLADRSES